jgi:hypothetical protein
VITYYVSGDEDIEPSSDNLRESGRAVVHGEEIDPEVIRAFPEGGRFVVVAHGNEAGTVFCRRGVAEPQSRWLWVGMDPRPALTRVYLYCCKAGPRLSAFLQECECFGHGDSVPMPAGPDADLVLEYLDAVDELMVQDQFEREPWRAQLQAWVAERMERATQDCSETNYRPLVIWAMLARSLADGHDGVHA